MLPAPGTEVGACGPQSPDGAEVMPRETFSRPSGFRVRCSAAPPSLPSKSFANPCRVLHEFPHRPAMGLSFLLRSPVAVAFPRELTGLLSRSRGTGLPLLLSNGLGSGLAALVAGAVLVFSRASSLCPSRSLRPEIRRRLRGRRVEDEAGVELVRTSLVCIAGDPILCRARASERAGYGEAAALIGCFAWLDVAGFWKPRADVYVAASGIVYM